MSLLAKILALIVGGTLSLAGAMASAAPRDPPAAEALFRAGRSAFKRGEYTDALQRFAESYQLEPAIGTLLNIASAEEKLGLFARAWERYSEALQQLPKDDERRAATKVRLERVEKQLAWLTLVLAPGSPNDTAVERGGVSFGTASFGVPLPVDPGAGEIVVSAPGRSAKRYLVELRQGDRQTLQVEPGPAEPAPEAASVLPPSPRAANPREIAPRPPALPHAADSQMRSAPAPAKSRTSELVGYSLVGGGVAAVAVAGIMGVLALDRAETVDEHCENKVCDPEGLAAGRSGLVFSTVGIGAAVAGFTSAGLGGYLLLSSGGSTTEVAWKGRF